MVDEDAGKKSVTDGMVKCLSMIGFAGDIFSGRWDDSKYVARSARTTSSTTTTTSCTCGTASRPSRSCAPRSRRTTRTPRKRRQKHEPPRPPRPRPAHSACRAGGRHLPARAHACATASRNRLAVQATVLGVRILKLTARAFSLGKSKDMRAFASTERMEQCRPTWEAFMTELTAARRAHHREMERMHKNRQYHRKHPGARTMAEVLARVRVPVKPPKPKPSREAEEGQAARPGAALGREDAAEAHATPEGRAPGGDSSRTSESSTVRAARTPATASPLGSLGSFPNSGANCAHTRKVRHEGRY
jgi:hypothetical protein